MYFKFIGTLCVCLIFLYAIVWNFRSPQIPGSWLLVKIGMTRKQAFDSLGWGGMSSSLIERDTWNYNPLVYKKDALIEIKLHATDDFRENDIVDSVTFSISDEWGQWLDRFESLKYRFHLLK